MCLSVELGPKVCRLKCPQGRPDHWDVGSSPVTLLGFSLADPWGNLAGGSYTELGTLLQAAEWGVKFPPANRDTGSGWLQADGLFHWNYQVAWRFLISRGMSG